MLPTTHMVILMIEIGTFMRVRIKGSDIDVDANPFNLIKYRGKSILLKSDDNFQSNY